MNEAAPRDPQLAEGSDPRDPVVAVVMPAYRVADQIGRVLDLCPPIVKRIFVVDDASPDQTGDTVLASRDPRVVLLRHSTNQGVGGSMATGFRSALEFGADIVVKCDGDGQMDPGDIPQLIRPIVEGRADFAKGCRFHHASELHTMPRIRFLGNIGLTFLTKLASGYWHVLDPQNGFLAFRAEILRRLPLHRLARGYFFENDMLIRLNILQARAADVPLPSRYFDETSSLRPARVLFEFPFRLLAGFWRRVFWRYVFYDVSPAAMFLFFGTLLFAFGFFYGGYHWVVNAIRGMPTPTGTVIVAAVPFILGFQLLLEAVVLDIHNSPRPGPRSDLEAPLFDSRESGSAVSPDTQRGPS